ncbi:reverse transcriptase domain-containing protein, partial [Tanacetum coccineum]
MAPKRTTRANPAATTATTSVTNAQLKAMIDQGVTDALAARDADRNTNGDDSHNSGTGVRRTERVARECTYPDFMKCQPLNFKGTEGVVELIQWFEKMETVFSISNCSVENQIKFSTCTLLAGALTWWNSHVRTVGHDVAYAMTWTDLKKKMTDKYCPRGEIKKLEAELWNLKVKGTDVIGYNQHFQELALLCVRMFPEESDKIERYVGGLPDMIHESVVASKPKNIHEAIEIATELMDNKIRTFVECHSENKIKQDDNQQQQLKTIIPNKGSPRVIVYGYDGLPMQPVSPPSSDNVPGPEHPPSPNYVPDPEHPPSPVEAIWQTPIRMRIRMRIWRRTPRRIILITLLTEGMMMMMSPLTTMIMMSPLTMMILMMRMRNPFEDEDDDKEEEEHLALADPSAVPVVDLVPSAVDTEAFETDESAPIPRSPQTKVPFAQTCLRRARKTVILDPPMSPSMEAHIAEYAAAPALPSPPLICADKAKSTRKRLKPGKHEHKNGRAYKKPEGNLSKSK